MTSPDPPPTPPPFPAHPAGGSYPGGATIDPFGRSREQDPTIALPPGGPAPAPAAGPVQSGLVQSGPVQSGPVQSGPMAPSGPVAARPSVPWPPPLPPDDDDFDLSLWSRPSGAGIDLLDLDESRPRARIAVAVVLALFMMVGVVVWSVSRVIDRNDPTALTEDPSLWTVTWPDSSPETVPGGTPIDAEWSRTQVTAALDTAFLSSADPALWSGATDGSEVVRLQVMAMQSVCGQVSPVIDSIEFTSHDDAFITFRLLGSSVPGADAVPFTGEAARPDGTWKVSGYTLEAVVAAAAFYCS